MSSTELGRRGFADYFLNAARLARTSAGIDIEIAESALLDNPENLRQTLKSLRTVAEGVETIEQLEILDGLGCEQSQGYLHSPPVSAEDLELLVASRATEAQP